MCCPFKKLRIDDIPTDTFKLIIEDMKLLGWQAEDKYREFDAWIDYAKVILKKDGVILVFEWDNWTEGVIRGDSKIVSKIAQDYELRAPRFVLL